MGLLYNGLPIDDVIRTVIAFGKIEKNAISESGTPSIDVILAPPSDLTNKTIGKVGLNDISYVEIGSFWQNRVRQNIKYWQPANSRGKRVETFRKEFVFDMQKNTEPKFIAFRRKGAQPLKEENIFEITLFDEAGKTRNVEDLYPSPFAELITTRNETVAIPTALLLEYTLVPRDLDMITKLINSDIDTFLEEYLYGDKKCEGDKYVLYTKKKIYNDETAIFLAYIACNETSRKNLQYLFQSLVADDNNRQHIFLFPYHPKTFIITAEGVKVAGRYFVQRITKIAPPNEVEVEVHYPGITTEATEKSKERTPYVNTNKIDEKTKEIHVHEDLASGSKKGIVNIKTSLKINNEDVNVKVIKEERKTTRKPAPPDPNTASGKKTDASSGETRSTDKAKKTSKVTYNEQEGNKEGALPMKDILPKLCISPSCRFGYLDGFGNRQHARINLNSAGKEVVIFWVEYADRTIYFLEIDVTDSDDKYRGMVFIRDDMSDFDVEKFLAVLREKKLRLSKLLSADVERHVDEYEDFTHIGNVTRKVMGFLTEYLEIEFEDDNAQQDH